MDYRERMGEHILFLNERETNVIFDAFADDGSMPSYLVRQGHRYIKEEPHDWLVANVGHAKVAWRHQGNTIFREIIFKDREHAMLFKLTFHGTG